MTERLSGKRAVITGAASGFGRATALAFAREGARIVVVDRNEAGAKETVALVEGGGGQALAVAVDISSDEGAASAITAILDRFGGIDVLVNNAGIAQHELDESWDISEERWELILRVNLKGVYLCARHAIPHMLAQGRGSIVNVASIAASAAVGGAAYAASKGGVLGYTKQVAIDLASRGVRVNAVSPGFMRTPMSTGGLSDEGVRRRMEEFGRLAPIGTAGEPEDIAEAIVYLASDASKYVTGQELTVDGGYRAR